ncbi:ABC transporter permease [Paenibacillus pinisoli]|uniref:ABC transporter permease n=1 Tax=Paenibacillus pinisoli TaxID=1276110 RepID=A0A3A6PBK3_9BACL|nr:ABC transporter permease [Paenibacillus pinisoli]RJX37066.1 ABC transporter permease [Paenibacillus pinisoli]
MIRLIYQSIINKKSKFILLMVQFTIGFAALLFGLSCIFNLLQYKKSIEALVPLDTVHAYINEDNGLSEKNINMLNKNSNVFEQLRESNLVEKLGLFETMYVYDSVNSEETKNESRLYILNNDNIEMSKLTLQEGTIEPLQSNVSSFEYIPVVVSFAMKDQYKVGNNYQLYYIDGQTQKYEKIDVRVVGILKSSTLFWRGGSTYISENIVNNKEFILAPQFKDFELAMTYAYNSLIQLPKHETREESLEQIKSVFEHNDLSLQYTTLHQEIDSYNERQKVVIISTVTFAAILLLLSLLGSIGAILTSISTRYRDFGIYYSLGFTKSNMIRLVLGEIIAVFGVSFVLAVGICKILFATLLGNEALNMNISVVAVAFVIMIICIILSTIMPFIKLKKIEPIELIKGVNR